MTDAYDGITHCIHCGLQGFATFEDVLKHVKEVHMKSEPGENLPELNGYD